MSKSLLLALLSSVTLAGFALSTSLKAADITEPIVEEAASNWSGCYIGAHAGYGEAEFDGGHELEEGDLSDPPELAEDLDVNGFAGGGHIGCNVQLSSPLVLGVEADATFMDWDDEIAEDDGEDIEGVSAEVDLLASLRARIGFAMDNLLIYATGGVAIADAEASTFEIGEFEADVDFDDIGGVVGGGLEFALSNHFTVRAEGLFYFFGDDQDFDSDDGAEEGDFVELDDAFVIRAGFSWYPGN